MSTGIEQDLDLAKQAARDAGAVIMRYFGSRMEVRHKDPDQPVTDAEWKEVCRMGGLDPAP